MSKMDRILNSKKDKETIYEIYRACRLCGAGAGYKMPIIQNVVDLDDTDVELKQKIRECVQIEVHQDDKMPPLICELCVDKVNDFYEFLEMCRQTNKRTRLRLGLPPQSMPRGAPDAGDCILGLTEPVFVKEDSDGEPLAKHKKVQPKVKARKEPELKVKLEKSVLSGSRSSRFKSRRSPTPPRITRHSKNAKDDNNVSLSRLQDKSKSSKTTPKSILKKETKSEDTSLISRLKRSRDREPVKLETPVKKVKLALKLSPQATPKSSPKTSPRITKSGKSPKPPPSVSPLLVCGVCSQLNKTPQAVSNHMKTHTVNFTNPKMACNPCGLWFSTAEEVASHHRQHRNKSKLYHCTRCTANFKHLSAYDEHLDNNQCIPWPVIPDVKCDVCWHMFATNKLLRDHKCLGEDHRPGGKCSKCNRNYALLKNLRKHEENCTAKKKGEFYIDPELLSKVRPIQIRVSRCDPLLTNIKQEHYDVSTVAPDFGLDKNCVYPYISSAFRIKSEPTFDGMVAINQDIKDEFFSHEDYVHWDSEESDSEEESPILQEKKKKVDSLATLTLKTIFSQRCLGKVPRKRRRVKTEKCVFDSLLGETEDDVTRDINNIINNLGNDDDDETVSNDENRDKSIDLIDGKNTSGDVSSENVDKETVVDNSTVVDKETINPKDVDKDIVDETTDNHDKSTGEVNENSLVENNDVNPEKNDQSGAQNDVSLSELNDSANDSVKNDQNVFVDNVSVKEKDANGALNNKNDGNSACDVLIGSNNNLSRINSDNNDESTRTDDKVNINNGTIEDISDDNNDPKIASSKEIENDILTSENKVGNDENQNDEVNDLNNDTLSMKNDFENDEGGKNHLESSQDSNSVGTLHESLLNDNTQSDVISENDEEFSDRNVNNAENETVKSQIDNLLTENVSQESKTSFESNLLDSNSDFDTQSNFSREDGKTNDVDRKIDMNTALNNEKSKNSTEAEDMDDTKLMEALDAEIGESNESKNVDIDVPNENIALEDLISGKNAEKPMDLDIIPEEFSFDT